MGFSYWLERVPQREKMGWYRHSYDFSVMKTQPIPEVSQDDVTRVVNRDFSAERHTEVFAILSEYGKESWQCGEDRVRLAVLKLAAGSVARLREYMNRAKLDYHGVLSGAEYPGYSMEVVCCGRPTDEHCEHAARTRQIIDEDWEQYKEWLVR